jgi:hypothetical protein
VLGHEYPYLTVIDVLMYLTNNMGSDIAFAVTYLAKDIARLLQCVIGKTLRIPCNI